MRLPRHTPVVLVAAACLLLGSTGGAVAGAMITGKQIKDNTVTTKDIKNGTLAVKDLSKKARKKLSGTPGPAGATGPSGAAGPRGFSAWDTIPSGISVTGRFYEIGQRGDPVSTQVENVELPARAPVAPSDYGFGNDAFPDAVTTTDPACTGTYSKPTAPPGRVCIYFAAITGLTAAEVGGWVDPEHAPYAFRIHLNDASAGGVYSYWGSWAYTAP